MKKIAALAAAYLWLSIGAAFAQTSPNLTFGQVLTPAQWNQLFINKQDTLGFTPLNTIGGVMSGRLVTAAPSATTAGLNLTPGTTPGSPVNGDLWVTSSGIFAQINGVTVGPFTEGTSGSFTGTSPIVVNFPGAGVVNYSFNFSVANTFLAQQTDQGATTTQPGWYAQLAGDTTARVRVGLNSTDVPSVAFGPGSAVRDTFLERAAAATFRLGSPDAATAIAQTLGVQNVVAGTSNTGGANLTINGSQGTGTGFGGSIIFQVAPAGSTGTAQNVLSTALTIFGSNGGVSTGAAIDEGAGTLNLAGSLYNNGTAPTGTGAYVRATSPTLVTPALGVATGSSLALGGATIGSNALAVTGTFAFSAGGSFGGALTGITTLSASGQITSTVATGTAPFSVASTTNVANLNASSLNGATFAAPGPIGSGTASTGAFTTLSASGTVSGSGFSTYLASPPAIGGTAAAAGSFTTLSATTYNGGALSGTFSGTPGFSGANFITRANLAQVAAASLMGNPTATGPANESGFTIQGLTNATPNSTLDYFVFYNHTTGTLESATASQISAAVGSGVTSLNSLNGALNIVAGNGISVTPSGSNITVATNLSSLTNSITSSVALNNTSNFFDGPSVAQGTVGTWFASGTVTIQNSTAGDQVWCKLWDGTTIISSSGVTAGTANTAFAVPLSGVIASPAGNIRISCRDPNSVNGSILSNVGALFGNTSSTVTVFRLQ